MLTQEQADRIMAVINEDAAIGILYRNNDGDTCAIGGLLQAAGFNVRSLKSYGLNSTSVFNLYHPIPHSIEDTAYTNRRRAVMDKARSALESYGLDANMALGIQRRNDGNTTAYGRRQDIGYYLHRLVSGEIDY